MEEKINLKTISRKYAIFFLLIIFVSSVLFFLFNYKTVLYTDDFIFSISYVTGDRIATVGDAIESFKYFCFNERANVRLASLLSMIYTIPNKQIFNIINTIIYMMLNIALYYNAFGFRKKLNPLGIVSVLSAGFLLIPAYGQSVLWVTGSANYLCSISAVILFIIPYRNYYLNINAQNKQSKLKGVLFAIFVTIYAFFAAWLHEQTALIMVVVSVVFIIGYKLKGMKLKTWMISGTISSLGGFILVTLGSLRRLEDESSGSGNLIIMIVKNFVMITIKLCYYLMPILLLILGIVLCLCLRKKKQTISKEYIFDILKDNMHIIAYALGGLASCYSMIIVPIFAIRAWCAPVIMFILVFLTLLDKFIDNLGDNESINKVSNIMALAVMICLVCSSIIEYNRVADVANQFNTRQEYILNQKSKGNFDIEVPLVEGISKYDVYYYADGFDVGAENNEYMAKYYGVNSITKGEYKTE